MRVPAGFEQQKNPLRHKLNYSFALSARSATQNSTICSLVRNHKSAIDATTIQVNPHNSGFQVDTGSIVSPMSIIDRLKMSIRIGLTDHAITTQRAKSVKVSWMPIFNSFDEKLLAVDDMSTDTVEEILELNTASASEQILPLFTTTKLNTDGDSEQNHPVSTATFAEVFGTLTLTTDTKMESVAFDNTKFHQALKYYTNKGAMKTLIGRTRSITLTEGKPFANFFIDKFVPRAIRRIVPYSYFGILFHVPVSADDESYYYSNSLVALKADVGIKLLCNYHEWNADHDQSM